jgi:choline dehydrogenase
VGDRGRGSFAAAGAHRRRLLRAQRLHRPPRTDADYDEWGPGWTATDLGPYLDRAEQELRTRVFGEDELSPWHRAFAEAGGEDAIIHAVNAVGAVRWSTAFAYLDPARARANLTIRADTLVDRIDPEAGTVITDRGELAAELIVLAAGAYGSPAILLRSGIGPGRDYDLPVGEGLTDHVGVGIAWEPTEELRRAVDGFAKRAEVYMAQVTLRVSHLFLFPALDPGWEISAAAFAMKPWSRGRVGLLSNDPAAPLLIEHGFLSDKRDAVALEEGVERLRELAAQRPVSRYAGQEIRPGSAVAAAAYAGEAARGFFHPTGTCALGSVVDADARVYGTANVVVADASIMPTIPAANTNLSTIAIAEKVAEGL